MNNSWHTDGWTAQAARAEGGKPYHVHEGEPGQVFTEGQLPHPDVQRASGIDPDIYRAHHGLHVEDGGDERPEVRGTESGAHPSAVAQGHMESFRSYPEGLPKHLQPVVEEDDRESTETAV